VDKNSNFYLIILLTTFYATAFLLSRIPFYYEFFVFDTSGDYGSYAWEAARLIDGQLPNALIRPPFYILYLSLAAVLNQAVWNILVFQSLFSLITGLAFIYLTSILGVRGLLASIIALFGAHLSEQWLLFETTLQPDVFYAGFILLVVGCLIRFSVSEDLKTLLCASFFAGMAILCRPSGIFLLPLMIIFSGYWWYVREQKIWLAALTPMLVLIFTLAGYNYLSQKKLALSVWGEMNLAGATMFLWKPNERYEDSLNDDIRRVQSLVDPNALRLMQDEILPDKLYDPSYILFTTYFKAQRIFPSHVKGLDAFSIKDYLRERRYIRQVAWDAIKENPRLYLKFVYTALWIQITNYSLETTRPVPELKLEYGGRFYGSHLVGRKSVLENVERSLSEGNHQWFLKNIGESELRDGLVSELVVVVDNSYPANGYVSEGKFTWLANVIAKIHNAIFKKYIWLILLPLSLIFFSREFFLKNIKSIHYFAPWLVILGSSLLVSLIEIGLSRYSFVWAPSFFWIGSITVFDTYYFVRNFRKPT
jgi:hypothetical protein